MRIGKTQVWLPAGILLLVVVVAIIGCFLAVMEWEFIQKYFLNWMARSEPADLKTFQGFIPLEKRLEMAAHVGEMFVAVHALIELCVLIVAVIAFFHDRHQLRESLFQSAFFSQLSLFNSYVSNLREGPLRGTECLEEWRRRLEANDDGDREFYWRRMSCYFLQVNSLLTMIEFSGIPHETKTRYAQLLEAHFSEFDNKIQECVCQSQLAPEIVAIGRNIEFLRKQFQKVEKIQ